MKHIICIILALVFAILPATADEVKSSAADESANIVKTTGGTLILLTGHTTNTSGQYIQIFNSATIPPNGTVPMASYATNAYSAANPSTGNFSFYVNFPCPLGITVVNSTTRATLTRGTTDTIFAVLYK